MIPCQLGLLCACAKLQCLTRMKNCWHQNACNRHRQGLSVPACVFRQYLRIAGGATWQILSQPHQHSLEPNIDGNEVEIQHDHVDFHAEEHSWAVYLPS